MTKNKEFTEVLGILEDVYGWNDTNELTEIQEELVNDVISVVKKLTIPVVMPRFLKTKYSLEKIDEHIHELSCRTEHWIHRGKLEDAEKLIRWRRRYDALNGA